MDSTEICIRFSHSVFCAGGLVTALLQCCDIDENSIVLVQAHGHLHADMKWQTLCRNEQFVSLPASPWFPNSGSCCIFVTPKEAVPVSQLVKNGVFLQYGLPINVLPSFKGLSCSIHYFISVTVQLMESVKVLHFPVITVGNGSRPLANGSLVQNIHFSNLSTFPANSMPTESFLSHSHPMLDDDGGGAEGMANNSGGDAPVYAIRDVDFVCTVCLGGSPIFRPGDCITFCLDFENGVQPCVAVKANFIQSEWRCDGSRLQDKILETIVRYTADAQAVYLTLGIPELCVCTFSSPIVEIRYQVDLEFYLGEELIHNATPFAWSLPIEVVHSYRSGVTDNDPTVYFASRHHQMSAIGEAVACFEPSASVYVQHLSHLS